MRIFFSVTFVVLLLMSAAIWEMRPPAVVNGKTVLSWVSDDNPMRQGQIKLFNEMNPTDLLQLDPSNGGTEKVIVQSLAGVGPDFFDCYNGFQLSAYVKSGIAWDVTDELEKMGIDVHKQVWKALYPDLELDGRIYGYGTNASADAMWFNKTLFEKAGVPFPTGVKTWQEFVPLAQKLTIRDEDGKAQQFGLLFDWSGSWLQFVDQWGGRLYSEDGTRCTLDSPESVGALSFMHDLIYKYKVTPSPVEEAAMATQGGWGSGTITLFGAGKGAMALGGRWWLCTLRDPKNYKDLRLGAFLCPIGKYYVYRGYGKGTLINKNSPRRKEALKFLAYLASPAYNRLINHQADGVGPLISSVSTPDFLHDPDYPNEDYNMVWRSAMLHAVPEQISPFVNGQAADRIISKQMDLIKDDQKSVEAGLKTIQEQIDEEIHKTIARDPSLRARYRKITGRSV